MESALITGGLGFIGSSLARKLIAQRKKVTIFSRSEDKRKNIKDIESYLSNIIIKDINEIGEEVRGHDIIFHCASTTHNYHIKGEDRDPFLDIEVNCNGTISLLEAVKNYNPDTRLVYLSTFFVNGNLDSLPANSNSPCNPMGLYPATRLAGEHFTKIYNQVFGLNSVVARLTNVFGIHEQMNNPKKAAFNGLIKKAMDGKEIPLYSNGEFVRDYIYIEDVTTALQTIAEKGERGQVYYVGRGEQIKFKDLMGIVLEEAGSGTIKSINPPNFHNQVGIKDYYCDNTPLVNLGWEPRVSLREGIKRTIDWYKEDGKN